jgi:predicted AlkP superfamily pyrophosphatase or phosphodiesterase
MNRKIAFVLLGMFAFTFGAFSQAKNEGVPRPKLVVGIMVDQMRNDYLYRFYDRYGEEGFKRLLREGFSCENTNIDYVPTVTAIGHASVYTGSVPAVHGITGNDFLIQATGQSVYCAEDKDVNTVGSDSDAGKMSPRNMLTTTITDELKLASNFRSKVIGIAIKDRGSILPAGHAADGAFWFDGKTGNWITSSYYMEALPAWAKEFNESGLVNELSATDWNTLYPIDSYKASFPDSNSYEDLYPGKDSATLPLATSKIFDGKNYRLVTETPSGNVMTFEFAKKAIEHESLGQRGETDFLALSLSSTDRIGHRYGPNSVEIEDTYLRLDLDIADFLRFLDEKVGVGNYSLFLTADHGAAHNPNLLLDKKIPAGISPAGSILRELNALLDQLYKHPNLVLSFGNSQIHLNNSLIETNGLDQEKIKKDVIKFMKKQVGVAQVIDMEEVQNASIPQVLKTRIINGYNPRRSGAIQLILDPGWRTGSPTGTGHSAWYGYDSHIPLIWMGWGINQGKSFQTYNMTDIASTLAALLHIQAPNGNIGQPILEVLK